MAQVIIDGTEYVMTDEDGGASSAQTVPAANAPGERNGLLFLLYDRLYRLHDTRQMRRAWGPGGEGMP